MTTEDASSSKSKDCGLSPRAEQRRQAFLDAAGDVFIEQGYDSASMSEIVRRAGGSLSTLYSQFGDKQGIFIAVLEHRMSTITDTMGVELASHAPVEEGLTRIGEQFATQVTRSGSVEFYRLMISIGRKHPQIAKAFMERGIHSVRHALAAYLEDRQAAGEVCDDDPVALAGLFLEMARSGLQSRALLDENFQPEEDEVKASVSRAVRVFLRGVARP